MWKAGELFFAQLHQENMGVCRKKEVTVSVSSAEEGLCVTKFMGTTVEATAARGTHLGSAGRVDKG